MRKKSHRLIIASSESCADLLYATGFFVPDDMVWLGQGRKSTAILSPLEIDRARRAGKMNELLDASRLETEWTTKPGYKRKRKATLVELAVRLLEKRRIRSVSVPASFPLAVALQLEQAGIRTRVEAPFFPAREIKTELELKHITRAQRQAEAGLERGIEVLKASSAGPGKILMWRGRKLTSEILRGEIDAAVIRAGGLPANTIVAGGNQACDPHERGSGPLKAGSAIILDIFPRDQGSGYFGDLTRTVVRGRAGEGLRALYHTVLQAQKQVLRSMRPGADGAELHRGVQEFFESSGYRTGREKGHWTGFFHGTGHSLGLEIHEAPRFGAAVFKPGHVMTVEPGLYYPGLGGVRIEDLVVVTKTGIRNLTRAEKSFEI